MIKRRKAFWFLGILIVLSLLIGVNNRILYAEDPTPSSQTEDSLKQQIKDLEGKISDLKGQAKTLSSQITVMDSQIRLTQLRINSTKEELITLTDDIDLTTKKISNLEETLKSLTKVLLNRITATYEIGSIQPLEILLSSSNISDFFVRANYLRITQIHDKKLVYETQQAKIDYSNQKQIFEDKKQKVEALKKQLENYTTQLNEEKVAKQRLLDETEGNETNYQRLLTRAKAQLAGFQRFVSSRGGASILDNQTTCDDWGCYYNQRDRQWGNNALNNTQYTIASDGCLVTSVAMIFTHYGHRSVTPATINSNSSNFASYYPAYLNKTVYADGATADRISSEIDSELNAGRPVIVGVGAGPDHFVVLRSGSSGNYNMNDPFVEGGHNVSFGNYYSVGSITEIDKVNIH